MGSVLNTINKSFPFIGTTQAAAEAKDCIIIFKREVTEVFFQFLKAATNLCGVAFVGLCIGLVKLIQNSFTITVPRVKGMGFYVGFQIVDNLIHIDTPLYLIGLSAKKSLLPVP